MALSNFWKKFPRAASRRRATVTGAEAAVSSEGFASVVAKPHHDKSDSSLTMVLPAKTACPRLKSKMLALVWRSSKKQEPSSQDTRPPAARKQAWLSHDSPAADSACADGSTSQELPKDDSSKVDAEKNGTVPKLHHQEDSPDDFVAGTAFPSPASLPEADAGVQQKTLSQLAREARMIEGQTLAQLAFEALELARQEMGELPHEEQAQEEQPEAEQALRQQEVEDPIQALELQWRESMFVNFDWEQQQQLRRAVGLPRQQR